VGVPRIPSLMYIKNNSSLFFVNPIAVNTAAKADVMIPAIFKILRLLVLNHQFLSDTISQISFQPRGVVATAGRIDYLSFTFVCRFKTI
jgi:hypothetical protein